MQGVGELEIQVQKGLVKLDDSARQQLWAAVKSGQSGVEFGHVFDKHVAQHLEKSTPGFVQPKKVGPIDEF